MRKRYFQINSNSVRSETIKKPEKPKFIPVPCHGCPVIIKNAVTQKFIAGRVVIFHSQKCMVEYENRNRPYIGADTMPAILALQRAQKRIEKLKLDVLYTIPGSHLNHVLEETIFELTYVIEGHEVVTKDERYGSGSLGAPHRMEVFNARPKSRML